VFGFRYSSLDQNLASEEKEVTDGNTDAASALPWQPIFEETAGKPHTEIGICLENSLENHCVLDIFSLFMLDLAAHISVFSCDFTTRRKYGDQAGGVYDEWIREPSIITTVTNGLVRAAPSLFTNEATAEAMVVLALLKYKLLKTQLRHHTLQHKPQWREQAS
jgi:hypothetical protein